MMTPPFKFGLAIAVCMYTVSCFHAPVEQFTGIVVDLVLTMRPCELPTGAIQVL